MRKPPIYLDANATTPLHPQVRAAMSGVLDGVFGNPSSLHPAGQEARREVERARRSVAKLLGCRPPEIVFTSGGTEANALALSGSVLARCGQADVPLPKLVIGAGEHASVYGTARTLESRGLCDLEVVGVDGMGRIRSDEACAAIDERTALASFQGANNEVGTVQELGEIATRCQAVGALLHVDAVQLLGKIPFDVKSLGADLVTISAHKAHGPKGAGALFVRKGVELEPLWVGGSQEAGRRPGTENVLGIVGLGATAELVPELLGHADTVAELRDRLERGLVEALPDVRAVASDARRVPGTTSLTFSHRDGASLLVALGAEGIACSMGSACSSGNVSASRVLLALGLDEQTARSTLRFSLSSMTTEEDIANALDRIPQVVARMTRLGGRRRRRPEPASSATSR